MKRHLFLALAAILSLSACGGKKAVSDGIPADKKEVMDRFLAGTLDPSYTPAFFFGHFPGANKMGDAAVQAHLSLFLQGGADMLKVQTEQGMPKIDDLTMDTPLVPEDFYRPTLEIIRKIHSLVGRDVYVVPTILSTYQVARQGMGDDRLPGYAVERPEAFKRMLDTQGGEMKFYDLPVPGGFFETFIRPYDMTVMTAANEGAKVTILHICDWEGPMDDLTRYLDYPGKIVNVPVSLNGEPFSPSDAYALFKRPVLGGFNRQQEIGKASPEKIAGMARDIIASGPKGRLILGADCSVPSPLDHADNIHAAVSAAHGR